MKNTACSFAWIIAVGSVDASGRQGWRVKKIGNPAPAGAPVKEIEVSAKKYEFTPAEIEVPLNTLYGSI